MNQQLCTVEPLYKKGIVKKKRKTLSVMLLQQHFTQLIQQKESINSPNKTEQSWRVSLSY